MWWLPDILGPAMIPENAKDKQILMPPGKSDWEDLLFLVYLN